MRPANFLKRAPDGHKKRRWPLALGLAGAAIAGVLLFKGAKHPEKPRAQESQKPKIVAEQRAVPIVAAERGRNAQWTNNVVGIWQRRVGTNVTEKLSTNAMAHAFTAFEEVFKSRGLPFGEREFERSVVGLKSMLRFPKVYEKWIAENKVIGKSGETKNGAAIRDLSYNNRVHNQTSDEAAGERVADGLVRTSLMAVSDKSGLARAIGIEPPKKPEPKGYKVDLRKTK